jgi:hypothetical protein
VTDYVESHGHGLKESREEKRKLDHLKIHGREPAGFLVVHHFVDGGKPQKHEFNTRQEVLDHVEEHLPDAAESDDAERAEY